MTQDITIRLTVEKAKICRAALLVYGDRMAAGFVFHEAVDARAIADELDTHIQAALNKEKA